MEAKFNKLSFHFLILKINFRLANDKACITVNSEKSWTFPKKVGHKKFNKLLGKITLLKSKLHYTKFNNWNIYFLMLFPSNAITVFDLSSPLCKFGKILVVGNFNEQNFILKILVLEINSKKIFLIFLFIRNDTKIIQLLFYNVPH